MSELTANQVWSVEQVERGPRAIYAAGALATVVQLLSLLLLLVVTGTLGGEPATAAETFAMLQADRLAGILRLDFTSLINVALFTVTSFAVYAALRRKDPLYPALATGLVFVGVALSLAVHSGYSMIYLSDQYAAATTAARQAELLAAGEALIASGWWHSSAGFVAGIFLQGGTVLLGLAMLRSRAFGRGTAYAALLGNGLDLAHIFIGLVLPGFATIVLSVGGIFYLAWYLLLGRDLYRLARRAR